MPAPLTHSLAGCNPMTSLPGCMRKTWPRHLYSMISMHPTVGRIASATSDRALTHSTLVLVGQPEGVFGLNLELWYNFYFLMDLRCQGVPERESAGCRLGTLERFSNLHKSKMAAILAIAIQFWHIFSCKWTFFMI